MKKRSTTQNYDTDGKIGYFWTANEKWAKDGPGMGPNFGDQT